MSEIVLNGKAYEVGDDVRYAVDLMTGEFGATVGHASDHVTSPRVAYTFPRHGGAQVHLPYNKRDLVVVLRDQARDGRSMTNLLPTEWIKGVFPRDGNAGSALMEGKVPYLKPTRDNTVLRVKVPRDELRRVLALYLDAALPPPPPAPREESALEPLVVERPPSAGGVRRTLSMDELLAQLARQAETGKAGELVAIAFERQRLREAGCPDPDQFVRHVALTDVGRGYDIESTWPGQERCIEVKSTTKMGSDIYLSENERLVLKALAGKAWLYRVLVTPEGGHVVGEPLRDPIASLEEAGMSVAVWRAADPSTSTMDQAQ